MYTYMKYAGPTMYTYICEAMLAQIYTHTWNYVDKPCTHMWSYGSSRVHTYLKLCWTSLAPQCLPRVRSHKFSTLRQTFFSCPTPKLQDFVHHISLMKDRKQVTVTNQKKQSQICWLTVLIPALGMIQEDYKLKGCWATKQDLVKEGEGKKGREEGKKKSCEICVCTWRKFNTVVIVTGAL